MEIDKYLTIFLLVVLLSISKGYSQLNLTGGSQTGNFLKFAVNDNHIEQGFRITCDIKLKPAWWSTEKKIISIRQYNSDNEILSFYIKNGTFTIGRPVKYAGQTSTFKLESWNKNMISQGQYSSATTMTFEIGFSEGSYKVFIWEAAADITTAVCEFGFWGLGSGLNGLQNKLDPGFFGTTYDIHIRKSISHGFENGTFEGSHNRNHKSCFTLNARHNGIPSSNMADPLSGVSSDGKKNCSGTGGIQAKGTGKKLNTPIISDLAEVKIYPVPVDKYLKLNFPQHWRHRKIEVQFVDMIGRNVISNFKFISNEKNEIDVSSLPSGVYILSISNGELIEKKQIVIE